MHWIAAFSFTVLLHGVCISQLKLPRIPQTKAIDLPRLQVVWVNRLKGVPKQSQNLLNPLEHAKTMTEAMLNTAISED